MKIQIVSDLHIDFSPIHLVNKDDVDCLVVAGDLCEFRHHNLADSFFEMCSKEFPFTLYVMGNHEFYGSTIPRVKEEASHLLDKYKNVVLLDNNCIVYKGIQFIGGTLWTDCNKSDPRTLYSLRSMMWDFRGIQNYEGMRFTPENSVDFHNKTLQYITECYKDNLTNVVISHHSPCHKSINERYANDVIMNGGFHSDLSEFILNRPQIKAWIHGHTHFCFDYFLGDTRIVCNARGYTGQGMKDENEEFNPSKIIEL